MSVDVDVIATNTLVSTDDIAAAVSRILLTELWSQDVTAGGSYSSPVIVSSFVTGGASIGPCVVYVTYEDKKCQVRKLSDGSLVWSVTAAAENYGRCQAKVLAGETNTTVFFPSHDGKIYGRYSDGTARWTVSNLYVREGGYGTAGLTPNVGLAGVNTVKVAGKNWELNSFVRSTTTNGTNASVRIISGTGSGATLYEIQKVNPADRAQLILVNATFPAVDGTSRIEIVPKYTSDVYWQHAGTLTTEGGVDYLIACGFDNSVTKIRCTDGVVTACAVNLENNEAWPLILDVGLGHTSVVFNSIEGIVRCLALSTLATEWTHTGTNGFDSVMFSGTFNGSTLQIAANGRDNKTSFLRAVDGVLLHQSSDFGGDLDAGPCVLAQGDGTSNVFVVGDAGRPTLIDSSGTTLWQKFLGTVFNSTPIAVGTNDDILTCDMDGNIHIYDQTGAHLEQVTLDNGIEGTPSAGAYLVNGKTQVALTRVPGASLGGVTVYEY